MDGDAVEATVTETEPVLMRWRRAVMDKDVDRLGELLAEEVVFRSPAVFAPQEGRDRALAHLRAAMRALGPAFRHVRSWIDDDGAVLEWECLVDGEEVHGVDLLQWNAEGLVTDVSMMVRPCHAHSALVTAMRVELLID